ncbi:restriction endonuclease subunit S [Aliikangiella sp. IMCC44632]
MVVKRERYTPHDVGPSPLDWEAPYLSDISSLITNGFVGRATPFYTDVPGIPYLYGKNVRANYLDPRGIRYITSEFHAKQSKTALKKGDLLTVQSGHIGETAVVTKEYENSNCHALIVTRPNHKYVHSDYLSYYINSEMGRARLKGLEVGSTILHINTKDLKKFRVLLPPLPEQQKIAKILSTWDKAISTTERLIDNTKQQKKALMQQLLTGKKRLLDDPGKPFEGEWKQVHLEEVCSVNPKKPAKPVDELVSFIPMDAVSEDTKLIRHEVKAYDEVSKGFTSFMNKDCLVAKITPCFENGKGAYVDNLHNGIGFGSTEFHVLRAREDNCTKFIYYITQTREFRVRGEMNMQGSAGQKRVTTDYLKLFKVNIPPSLIEQQKVTSVMTNADKEIELLEQQLADLKQEKKALMQQLLTGKRRVAIDNKEVA